MRALRVAPRAAVQDGSGSGRSRNPASNLHGKPYNLRLYGFNPVIPDRYRYHDRRRNLDEATRDLVWQFDPARDWQRGFFHHRREYWTSGDGQSVETILGCRTTRRDNCYIKSGETGVAVHLFTVTTTVFTALKDVLKRATVFGRASVSEQLYGE
jgi:hypothetical protein